MSAPTYRPSGFFILRSPTASFDELRGLTARLKVPTTRTASSELDAAVAHDRLLIARRLTRALREPLIREALYLASPSFEARIDSQLRADSSEPRRARTLRTAFNYFVRMTTRPTPFGTFAGYSVGRIGAGTRITLAPLATARRRTRLDWSYLSNLCAEWSKDRTVRPRLRYLANTTLFVAGRTWRYIEESTLPSSSPGVSRVVRSDYLDQVLALAGKATPFRALIREVRKAAPGVDHEEATSFVHELIDQDILVPTLEPPITGIDGLGCLLRHLRDIPELQPHLRSLREVRKALASVDRRGLGVAPKNYRTIAARLPIAVGESPPSFFQVDVRKTARAAILPTGIVEEVAETIKLMPLFAGRQWEEPLQQFRQRFEGRYGERTVPLLEALDEEVGIGFQSDSRPNPGSDSLMRAVHLRPRLLDTRGPWNATTAFLLEKVVGALSTGQRGIQLNPAETLSRLRMPVSPLPDTFDARFSISAASTEDLRRGDYSVLLLSSWGPSGIRILGRFCDMDRRLTKLVRAHLSREEQRDHGSMFAELAHLPRGLGNLVFRPRLREHEIHYMGRGSASGDRRLLPSMLVVSVRNDEIVLTHATTGRRVIPRASHVHNFDRSPFPAYRFLCALQTQGCASNLDWNWGNLASLSFLPRVSVGRVFLSRARWNTEGAELRKLAEDYAHKGHSAVREWRSMRSVPRFASLVVDDHELLVDFENSFSVDSFLASERGQDRSVLLECLPDPDHLWLRGPEGSFSHEIVVPFERVAGSGDRRPDVSGPRAGLTPKESFGPGSEWVYLKVFSDPATVEDFLTEAVRPLVRSLLADQLADRWFFIRYDDPAWHLRLRIHAMPTSVPRVLERVADITNAWLAESRVWRIQWDTFEPEIQRYGGEAAWLLSEEIFCADSDSTLEAMGHLQGVGDIRWLVALYGVDRLLSDFGLGLREKRQVAETTRTSFDAQFQRDSALKHKLHLIHRTERKRIEGLLSDSLSHSDPLRWASQVFERRSVSVADAIGKLREMSRRDRLGCRLIDLARLHSHMHLNRLFRSAAQIEEALLYGILAQVYNGWEAQGRHSS